MFLCTMDSYTSCLYQRPPYERERRGQLIFVLLRCLLQTTLLGVSEDSFLGYYSVFRTFTLLAILHQYSQGYWGHSKEEPFVWGSFRYDIIFPQPLLPSILIHLTLACFLSVGKIKQWCCFQRHSKSFHLDLLILLKKVNKSLLLSVWLAFLIDQVKTGSLLCQISAENKVVTKVKFFSGRNTLRGARETLSGLRAGSFAGVKGSHGHIVRQANVSPEELVDTMGLSSRVPLYCLCATLLTFF